MLFTHETRGNVECKDHHHMYRERFILLMGIIHACMYLKVESSGLMSVHTIEIISWIIERDLRLQVRVLPIEFYHSLEM